ncbi:MAG TPA: DPP IV N-terminal domain-containing protein [Phycisphaerae bacterium]|nr:DPP IV N-terminal domain-containing protein [Phycisphaerae bacterium]
MRIPVRIWFLGVMILSAAVIALPAGCESAQQAEIEVVVVPPPPPEPQLTSAGDVHLTLFGEFPDRQRVPFHARAASPMKQHTFETEGADFDVDISPDGKYLVFASTRHSAQPDLYLKTVDGRAVTQLTDDPAGDVQPCFSPDGQYVAFASHRSGNWDLWIVGLQGGRATQITHSPQHEVHPSFSPDGRQLAYCLFNQRTETWELWVLSLAHPESKKMIGLGLFPRWSPKSDSIVYQKARERGGRWFSIWRVDLRNGEPGFPVELAASSEMALIQPSWSPDGAWITYGTAQLGTGDSVSEASGGETMTRGDIWVIRADGSSAMQLTDSGVNFGSVWGPDGRIYFTSRQNGRENIWSVRPLERSTDELTAAAPAQGPSTASGVVAQQPAPKIGS